MAPSTRIEPPMDRSRPTRVKVGPTTWRITYDHAKVRDFQRLADSQFTMGCTRPTHGDIIIDALTLPESHVREVLLHELLHAVQGTFQIDVSSADKDERDEQWVARTTSPVLLLLRDNPHLVRYLTQPDQEPDQDQEGQP